MFGVWHAQKGMEDHLTCTLRNEHLHVGTAVYQLCDVSWVAEADSAQVRTAASVTEQIATMTITTCMPGLRPAQSVDLRVSTACETR